MIPLVMSPLPSFLCLLSLLFFLLSSSPCLGLATARSIEPDRKDADLAVELDATSFNSTLFAAPARYAIVEFFASWCPACRNYKPQYERIAKLFNGPDAIHPGTLFMAKVDCALQVNNALCDQFKISHYPTLFWAPALKSKWVPGRHAGWEEIRNSMNAELLLQTINKKIGTSYTLEDARPLKQSFLLHGTELDIGQVAVSVYDIEEATAKAMDIIVTDKLLNDRTRPVFIRFLQLLVVHHPSRICKKGIADLLISLEDWWPSLPKNESGKSSLDGSYIDNNGPDYKALEKIHICGEQLPRNYWIFCRGSRKETRGYSCGLWLLLHAVSVRVEDRMAATAFQTICGFVGNFFNCKECSRHFLQHCSSAANEKISSRQQLVLWLWKVHNKVNERLREVEISLGTADPEFLKQQWPPETLCKSCWNSVDNRTDNKSFSLDEVYRFLLKFYGHSLSPANATVSNIPVTETLTSGQEFMKTRSMTVPLGAAMAIALLGCGFGAIACFWRTHQKKTKQERRRA